MENEIIIDLLITALEGGSNYWYIFLDARGNAESIIDDVLINNKTFDVMDIENDTDKLGELSIESIGSGISLFKKDYQEHYQDVINERWDAISADVFFQLCILGDIVFG